MTPVQGDLAAAGDQKLDHSRICTAASRRQTREIIWSIGRDFIRDVRRNGFAEHTYRLKLDPKPFFENHRLSLANITIGITAAGIYQIDGDILTIC